MNIKDRRKALNLTQREFAEKLNVNIRTVQKWEKEERNMSSKALLLLQDLETKMGVNTPIHIPEGKIINDADYPTKEVFVIPIKGRGGLENNYYDEVMFKELEKEVLTIKEPSSVGSKWFKIEVEGISMDDGSKRSLAEGDWAYCRSIERQYWRSKFHTHKWEIFCFFHNTRGVIFKKIKEQNTETGELLLESLNKDKEQFPDFTINVAECTYICNVMKVLSEF